MQLGNSLSNSSPVTYSKEDTPIAFYQIGSGSNSGPGVVSGSSLLLVFILVPRIFLWVLRYPLTKNHSNTLNCMQLYLDTRTLLNTAFLYVNKLHFTPVFFLLIYGLK